MDSSVFTASGTHEARIVGDGRRVRLDYQPLAHEGIPAHAASSMDFPCAAYAKEFMEDFNAAKGDRPSVSVRVRYSSVTGSVFAYCIIS